jgi:predicted RNA-binding Zn-ribbon protein involved in translation (DUF1610 family)
VIRSVLIKMGAPERPFPVPGSNDTIFGAPCSSISEASKVSRWPLVMRIASELNPSCGLSISPAEVVRIDSERMRCPKCGHVFEAGMSPGSKR